MSGPKIIGLTGSIGMGKSTVAQMFGELGVPVFDADAAVHILQGPGGALVDEIEAAFPGSTNENGVNRTLLSPMVLGDKAALQQLEAIIHPAVGAMRQDFLKENEDAPFVLFDIPLLFEKTGTAGIDYVVVVSASQKDQRARVLARPGMTEKKFEHIKALQMPDAEKREKADYIVDTSCSLNETQAQVQKIVFNLKASLA